LATELPSSPDADQIEGLGLQHRLGPPVDFQFRENVLQMARDGLWCELQVAVASHHGRLDVLVNNAGIVKIAAIAEDETLEGWRKIQVVNAEGVFQGTREAIRVNSIHPGFIGTAIVSGTFAELTDEQAQALMQNVLSRIPMGRVDEPKEIGSAILFLASDESSHMTGSKLVIDGGYTAR
jgi:3alpha(or 20beta)-hydroxysteroid dehydrogenase